MARFTISQFSKPLTGAILALALGLGCASKIMAPPAKPPSARPLGASAAPLDLASFDRAWEIIDETFYDTNFHGVNWLAVRRELRPRALVANREQTRALIQEMLDRLGQSHMRVIPRQLALAVEKPAPKSAGAPASEENSRASIGLEARWVDGAPLVVRLDPSGPAAGAGVRPGWILKSIDGEDLRAGAAPIRRHFHEPERSFLIWRMINNALIGPADSIAQVEFLDGRNRPVTLSLRRRNPPGAPVRLGNFPLLFARYESKVLNEPDQRRIGYVHFNLFLFPVSDAFNHTMDTFRKMDGIILDLRGNLGGVAGILMGMSGYFFDAPASLGTMKMRGADLKILANPRLLNTRGERVGTYHGPLAIVTDPLTLSAAEIFAGGMQELKRARIFGEQTGGQALPAVWDHLPNGDILYHAFADFQTPRGRRLEGFGVRPDVVRPYQRAALLAGRDPALEAAVDWILAQSRRRP